MSVASNNIRRHNIVLSFYRKLPVVKLLSKRRWILWCLKGRSSSSKGQKQRWDSRQGVFEHSRHSVWLLWHLSSVWRLQHLSTPSVDKCKMTEWPHIFLQNITQREKYTNDKLCRVVDPNCEVHDLLLVDFEQEVPDMRSGGTPPTQFNPCIYTTFIECHSLAIHKCFLEGRKIHDPILKLSQSNRRFHQPPFFLGATPGESLLAFAVTRQLCHSHATSNTNRQFGEVQTM